MGVTQLPGATCPCISGESILSDVQRQTEPCGHGGEEEEEENAGQMAGFNHSSSCIGLPRLRAGTAACAGAVRLGLGSPGYHQLSGCLHVDLSI